MLPFHIKLLRNSLTSLTYKTSSELVSNISLSWSKPSLSYLIVMLNLMGSSQGSNPGVVTPKDPPSEIVGVNCSPRPRSGLMIARSSLLHYQTRIPTIHKIFLYVSTRSPFSKRYWSSSGWYLAFHRSPPMKRFKALAALYKEPFVFVDHAPLRNPMPSSDKPLHSKDTALDSYL